MPHNETCTCRVKVALEGLDEAVNDTMTYMDELVKQSRGSHEHTEAFAHGILHQGSVAPMRE